MIGIKSHQHKRVALLLILLLLFFIFGLKMAFSGKDMQINSISDLGKAVKIYFSWLGSALNNIQLITAQAIKMNWKGNSTT
ncbi:hypothetical protein A3K82_02815 [Candidatus Pacearchaeota archaeon RBG_19FT_COMBO_34_9]|nr:MAG: hypothetical protein A3K82_02815 [Candidatus Pacearchaeota archaeon RBG_19FT_COMBO_34_9]OGJ16988.1 MAG: hypothetical protein A3K74_01190 [Candidatus Pacearchaeota archaeon RBG_13_33_26]